MTELADHWWWPFGEGRRAQVCTETAELRDEEHLCNREMGPHYYHLCDCGFVWAARVERPDPQEVMDRLAKRLAEERKVREEFPLGLLRRKTKEMT